MAEEIKFDKYKKRGSMHWREMTSRDPRVFNAFQQARYEWVIKIAGDFKNKKVLDLGCGDGCLVYLLAKKSGLVTGVDNDELGIKFADENLVARLKNLKNNYKFVCSSVYDLPFPESSFDLVISSEVIEHLQEPDRMLVEAKRVLKSSGKIILTTPYRLTETPSDHNHVKEYYPEELKKYIGEYFTDVEFKLTHHMLWRSLYTYAFRRLGNRPLGRWVLNIFILLFGWNPFMIDYKKMTKFDLFAIISIWGSKK